MEEEEQQQQRRDRGAGEMEDFLIHGRSHRRAERAESTDGAENGSSPRSEGAQSPQSSGLPEASASCPVSPAIRKGKTAPTHPSSLVPSSTLDHIGLPALRALPAPGCLAREEAEAELRGGGTGRLELEARSGSLPWVYGIVWFRTRRGSWNTEHKQAVQSAEGVVDTKQLLCEQEG